MSITLYNPNWYPTAAFRSKEEWQLCQKGLEEAKKRGDVRKLTAGEERLRELEALKAELGI